jgi:hypothetical protein
MVATTKANTLILLKVLDVENNAAMIASCPQPLAPIRRRMVVLWGVEELQFPLIFNPG